MTSAREIRAKVRAQERERGRLREAAITRLLDAGTAVAETEVAVADAKKSLREKVLAKLDADCAKLDEKVTAKEIEAGLAVIEAMSGELAALGAEWREGDLRDLTGFQLAELRRWARRARGTEPEDATESRDGSTGAAPEDDGASVDDAGATGAAVAVPVAGDEVAAGDEVVSPQERPGLAFGTDALA